MERREDQQPAGAHLPAGAEPPGMHPPGTHPPTGAEPPPAGGYLPATGPQYEITRGPARAVVTGLGAGLRAFEVDGASYVESHGADEPPPSCSGAVLLPWPNRVADGRWSRAGSSQQLALTEPARRNAIHGLVRHVLWTPVLHEESTVVLRTAVPVQPGWPVPLITWVRYALEESGLVVTHTVDNAGRGGVPLGLGVHPFLRAGAADADECTLRLSARTRLPVDAERLLPAGDPRPLDEQERELVRGRRLEGVELDTAFGGARPDPATGLVEHTLTDPNGCGVRLWADPAFGWVQVYTAPDYPGRGRAVAVEPMTCPPDALNSGTDLVELDAGARWTGRWGLRPC
ncbi:aldose 1-epimerase family protein [Salinifilum aidingensis]